MTVGTVTRTVWAKTASPVVLLLSSMTDADYADRFTLVTDAVATPEQWARAMFGDVPTRAELLIWRGILRLRLDRRRAPSLVAGWRVTAQDTSWIRLEAASRLMTGNLIVQTASRRVSLTTVVGYDRRTAASVWRPLAILHRRLVPGILRDADQAVVRRSAEVRIF